MVQLMEGQQEEAHRLLCTDMCARHFKASHFVRWKVDPSSILYRQYRGGEGRRVLFDHTVGIGVPGIFS